ncbi:MAG TPA: hypothetical protein VF506_00435 [Streptosporangiaceae bacterium]
MSVAACRDSAMDLLALIDSRARELVIPAYRDIADLRLLDVPEETVQRLFDHLRRCCDFHVEERALLENLIGRHEEIINYRPGMTVKQAAALMRPHLAVIAEPENFDITRYEPAVTALLRIIDAIPHDRLVGGGMQRALGPGRHALLMGFVDGTAEPRLQRQNSSMPSPQTGVLEGGVGSVHPPGGLPALPVTRKEAA